MEKPKLSIVEKQIIKALLEHDYALSTRQVAKLAGDISWNTANKYLKRLDEKGWIEHGKIGNKDIWRAYQD